MLCCVCLCEIKHLPSTRPNDTLKTTPHNKHHKKSPERKENVTFAPNFMVFGHGPH